MGTRSTRTIRLVMRHEFMTTVGRRSFWLTTFLLPLAIMLLSVGMQAYAQPSIEETVLPLAGQEGTLPRVGYVDQAGVLERLPSNAAGEALVGFPDEAAAERALREPGQISEYYVIPADYVQTGALTLVTKDRRPLAAAEVSPLLAYALAYNLTGDEQTALLLARPVVTYETVPLAPSEDVAATTGALAFAVPYAALFILYLVLVMTGGFMLTSVAKEKENRTAEVLLVSVAARELMLGKIVGLAGVGLLQMAVWLGAGLVALSQVERLFDTLGSYHLPAGFVPWTVAYFLGGFLLYGAIYAALGVMAHTVREASQLMYVTLVPLVAPLFLAGTLIEQPHGWVSVTLSLFPLTSPIAMVTRVATGPVPPVQLVAGFVLLLAAAYGVVLLAGRFFSVENLLSDRSFSWRRLLGQFSSTA